MENHELRITWPDGSARTYIYPSLAEALHHAIGIASTEHVTRIEVWAITNRREFAYTPVRTNEP